MGNMSLGHSLSTFNSKFILKICVINTLEFVTFDFFKEYFLNLRSLKSITETLVNQCLGAPVK